MTQMKPGERLEKAARNLQPRTQAEAIQAVFQGTLWLSAHSVDCWRPEKDESETVDRWWRQGKVFAVEWNGVPLYPAYVFDGSGLPIPEVAIILQVFAEYRPMRIASWFESANSMLRGGRPREVLARSASAVLKAAVDHAMGPQHG